MRYCDIYRALSIGSATIFTITAAHAASTIDQSNLADPGQYGFAQGQMILNADPALSRSGTVQTITAGLTGTLAAIDLQIFRNPNAPAFSVSLYSGDFIAGGAVLVGSLNYAGTVLPLQSQAVMGSLFNVDLTGLNYQVASGSVFSVLVSVGSATSGGLIRWAIGTLAQDGSAASLLNYSGGTAAFQFGDGSVVPVLADRGFRTYVDVAGVPEPATWSLMLLGFGAIGFTMRRRHSATVAISYAG